MLKTATKIAGQTMVVSIHDVCRYEDNEVIGRAVLYLDQLNRYLSMSDKHVGSIRLGALPLSWYALDEEYQDMSEDTIVYLSE